MEASEPLLQFFKALADANRLRIVGLLARRPHSVEELAAVLELRPSTVSHHVAKLAGAGLVTAQVQGHSHLYALDTEALEGLARKLLATDELSSVASDRDGDAWDDKVLATFTGPDGRLKAMPMQRKKFEAILRRVVRGFEPGRSYVGKEVDDELRRWSDDVATLRRGLVDHRMMDRERDGSRYWRV